MAIKEKETEFEKEDVEAVEKLKKAHQVIKKELAKVIVGQDRVIDELLTCIFARGHCLLEGVPGLAKTLMVKTLAQVLNLKFRRIQFTPDLMPADITGTEILQEDKTTKERVFRFVPGPIFANIILADEINRTPPKTQSALLEAMQEYRVTSGGKTYELELPFFVLATQNPIEQEGTYPLPEAQVDRFMFKTFVDYPSEEEEKKIVRATTGFYEPKLEVVLEKEEILRLQEIVRKVPVADHVVEYANKLARSTRPVDPTSPSFVKDWVAWGAGPRASIYLILGAKAHAVLRGQFHASCSDVQAVAYPVLRHRIITNFTAEAAGINSDGIIKRLLETIPTTE
jgi:MoxR-like ATPase